MMRVILILVAIVFLPLYSVASTWTVDSLSNAGFGSLRAAIDSAQNGDTVRFNSSLIANGSDSLILDSSIVFSKSITIKGLFNATDTLYVSGQDTDRVFTVTNTSNLYLDSLVACDGIFDGGVIHFQNSDSLFITNCFFSKCLDSWRNGGAIYLDGSFGPMYLKVDKCDISENQANLGAAIFGRTDGYLYIEILNSNLSDNYCFNGGSVGLEANSTGSISITMNIDNSSLNRNGGGAIKIEGETNTQYAPINSQININKSEIQGNYKGGINVSFNSLDSYSDVVSSIVIDSSVIKGNIQAPGILHNVLFSGGGGGAEANLGVFYSEIDSNGTLNNYSGGGIVNSARILQPNGVAKSFVTIENSTISDNLTLGRGGGLKALAKSSSNYYNANSELVVNIRRSTFYGNSSSGGGAINTHSQCNSNTLLPISILNIENSTLYGNTTPISALAAGAIFCSMTSGIPSNFPATTVNIKGSIIAQNTTPQLVTFNGDITSSNYNVYSDNPNNTSNSDLVNVSAVNLNLDSPNYHSGITKTLLPQYPSIALNSGNPTDLTGAQNGGIIGVRDRGAGESCISTALQTVSACDSLTWINGITYYSSVNNVIETLFSSTGCDSIVTLDLTINNTSYAVDTVLACDSLTWVDGMTYYSDTIVTETLISSIGCDSIVTLNLTIHTLDISVSQNVDTIWANETGATYQWVDCSSGSIIPGEINREFVPDVSGIYSVEISKNGCVRSSNCYSVNVCDQQPSYSYLFLANGEYSFTNTSTGIFTDLHWAFGDGSTSILLQPNHTYLANGAYVVSLAIHDSNVWGNGCITYFTDTVLVNSVANSLVCNAGWVVYGDSNTGGVTVINSSVGSNLSYQWDFGDGNTSNVQFPSHIYQTNGPFNLCLTVDDGNGCTDTYCDTIGSNGVWFKNGFELNVKPSKPVGLDDVELLDQINVYPNPTSDILNISGEGLEIVEIKVYDATGKLILVESKNFERINVSKLAVGWYQIQIKTQDGIAVTKFMKQ